MLSTPQIDEMHMILLLFFFNIFSEFLINLVVEKKLYLNAYSKLRLFFFNYCFLNCTTRHLSSYNFS